MKTKCVAEKCLLRLFLYFLILIFVACSKNSDKELKFAVIGDVHYEMPDYKTAEYLVPFVARELDTFKVKPQFIIQTGDFLHAGRGSDIQKEASFAFNNFAILL